MGKRPKPGSKAQDNYRISPGDRSLIAIGVEVGAYC